MLGERCLQCLCRLCFDKNRRDEGQGTPTSKEFLELTINNKIRTVLVLLSYFWIGSLAKCLDCLRF